MTDREVVEADGEPGLVVERRTDGAADVHQERVVVAIDGDDGVEEVDTAADRVESVDGHTRRRLVRDVLGAKLEGSA